MTGNPVLIIDLLHSQSSELLSPIHKQLIDLLLDYLFRKSFEPLLSINQLNRYLSGIQSEAMNNNEINHSSGTRISHLSRSGLHNEIE